MNFIRVMIVLPDWIGSSSWSYSTKTPITGAGARHFLWSWLLLGMRGRKLDSFAVTGLQSKQPSQKTWVKGFDTGFAPKIKTRDLVKRKANLIQTIRTGLPTLITRRFAGTKSG